LINENKLLYFHLLILKMLWFNHRLTLIYIEMSFVMSFSASFVVTNTTFDDNILVSFTSIVSTTKSNVSAKIFPAAKSHGRNAEASQIHLPVKTLINSRPAQPYILKPALASTTLLKP